MRTLGILLFALCWRAQGQYDQPYRPQAHFSPKQNWTNDPNGLVYFEGEYHLFFQYNPFGDVWGHMSWGHAVSTDLVHWRELPVALPEEDGIMIFTGSTVVDERNTSGFCQGGKPCLVAIYTAHTPKTNKAAALQTQNLAYSNDKGRTWTKYRQNPVLNLNLPDFRDPAVIWSKASKAWIMGVSLPDDHKIRFYRSADLKAWRQVSDFGPAGAVSGQWECPDLFELPVDGDAKNTRWVLKVGLNPGGLQGGSGEQYFVGRFDGTRFISDNPASLTLWSDYGKDCYCALTFNNMPATAKPVMLGWMNNWQYANQVPTSPWRGQMTIPRQLALKTYPEGVRLVQQPLAALTQLREKHVTWKGNSAAELTHTFLFEASTPLQPKSVVGWKLTQKNGAYLELGYDAGRQEVFIDRTHGGASFHKDFPARTAAPLPRPTGPLRWQVLVDRNSVELFADGGRVVITNLIFPGPEPFEIHFHGDAGKTALVADAWTLKSIWPGGQGK